MIDILLFSRKLSLSALFLVSSTLFWDLVNEPAVCKMGPKNSDVRAQAENEQPFLYSSDSLLHDRKNFHSRLITKNETRVHYFKIVSKIQSKQWKHSGSLPTKKFKQAACLG